MSTPLSPLDLLRQQRDATTDPALRAALDAAIAAMAAQQGAQVNIGGADSQSGDVAVGDVAGRDITRHEEQTNQQIGDEANVGVAVAGALHGGVHIGVIKYEVREAPAPASAPTFSTEERRVLDRYLPALEQKYRHLMLRNRVAPERTGHDERSVPELYLEHVYTTLTTDGPPRIVAEHTLSAAQLRKRLAELAEHPATPEAVEPQDVRRLVYRPMPKPGVTKRRHRSGDLLDFGEEAPWSSLPLADEVAPRTKFQVREHRPELAVEALAPRASAPQTRLVLLGAPGSGKSTVLRYVALLLARALKADAAPELPGWSTPRIPFFVPLGALTPRLNQQEAADALIETLLAELSGFGELVSTPEVRRLLFGMLPRAILLLDGLDELSAEARPGQPTDPRSRVITAIRALAADYPETTIVVTCRERPYRAPRILPPEEGWETRLVQPFAQGQVQGFVRRWYQAMAHSGEASLGPPQAEQLADDLLQQLAAQPALAQAIAAAERGADPQPPASPLLLTMLAIVHYNLGGERLPTERARLYEQLVVLLLHRWEPRRSDPFVKGRDLLTRLKDPHGRREDELPSLTSADDLRAVLHETAFIAHRDAPAGESRGVIDGDRLFGDLKRFFANKHGCDSHKAVAKAELFLDALKDEAGLLVPHGDRSYQFPHLTFQEYLAACYLAEHEAGEEQSYAVWAGKDGDRWREVLLLFMGCLRRQRLEKRVGRPWLCDWLLGAAKPKSPCQAQRDALLAADCYTTLGGRAVLDPYASEIEARLPVALAAIFTTPPAEPACLAAAERVRAGVALGELGDPRPGVCELPPPFVAFASGSFQIGITETEYRQIIEQERENGQANVAERWHKSSLNELPVSLAAFELARYPVTNAQFARFIDAGGYEAGAPWWSDAAREWLARDDQAESGLALWQQRQRKDQPAEWEHPRRGRSRPNHPIVGISWYEANAFCGWLTQHLNDGYIYRLSSEAEWEYAARGPARRPYPWGDQQPDSELANYSGAHGSTSAVACFPCGATPEGLHDMAGNVWEWTRSEYRPYPYDPNDGREEDGEPMKISFTLRGGGWGDPPFILRASNRDYDTPDFHYFVVGFRLARHLKTVNG